MAPGGKMYLYDRSVSIEFSGKKHFIPVRVRYRVCEEFLRVDGKTFVDLNQLYTLPEREPGRKKKVRTVVLTLIVPKDIYIS
jgi:hypothetical protein